MRVHQPAAAGAHVAVADADTLRRSHVRSSALAAQWRERPAYRALAGRFAELAEGEAIAAAATELFEQDAWVGDLLAPLIAALGDDPWFEPPLRVSRDRLRTGAILFEGTGVSITATVLDADALASAPPPTTIVVPGRLSVVRYVRGGGARLRLWAAEAAGEDFTAAEARPCTPLGVLPIADGVVLRLDGRCRAQLIENARSAVVMLTATIRPGSAPFMREYARADGRFLRCATLDDAASRSHMLLTLLRHQGRADAAGCFAAATRHDAFFLRWQAVREWLALDVRGAAPRLAEMARSDPHAEVRRAAETMLPIVTDALAGRRCPA